VKFTSIAWTHDNKGFFYNRYPEPKKGDSGDAGTETEINLFHELCYHFLGTEQSEDILCWRDGVHGSWLTDAKVSDDGQYLVVSISEGCDPVNRLYLCDLKTLPEGVAGFRGTETLLPFQKLVDSFEAQYSYVANDGPVFTFFTNRDAPRYKIARVNIESPLEWCDVIPESDANVVHSVDCVNVDQLLVCYISDVKHVLQIHELGSGKLIRRLPIEIGTVSATSVRRYDPEIFFSFTSFLTPGTVFRCDLSAPEPAVEVLREVGPHNFDRSSFETKQVRKRNPNSLVICFAFFEIAETLILW
jgi:prolyl oligopeptidase